MHTMTTPSSRKEEEVKQSSSAPEIEDKYYRKSTVWNHFSLPATRGEATTCNICKTQFTCWRKDSKTGNVVLFVTNLTKHLRNVHNIEVAKVQSREINNTHCPYCSTFISSETLNWKDGRHLRTTNCVARQFYNQDWWSNSYSAMDNKSSSSSTSSELDEILGGVAGGCSVYVVRNGKNLNNLIYVGMTSIGMNMDKRFNKHRNRGTFIAHAQVERAVLMDNLRKDQAEFLEALLIMISPPKMNLLNDNNEFRHLGHFLTNNDASDPFHKKVLRHHEQACQLLASKWDALEWTKFSPVLCEEEKDGKRQRGDKQRTRSPTKHELKNALEQKQKALDELMESKKKWKRRAWTERADIQQLRLQLQSTSGQSPQYSAWSPRSASSQQTRQFLYEEQELSGDESGDEIDDTLTLA